VAVLDYLGGETLDRLEETQWLLALIRDITAAFRADDGFCANANADADGATGGRVGGGGEDEGAKHQGKDNHKEGDLFSQHPLGRSVRLLYMNHLARMWYDFDSLQCFRTRPVRSYRRLRADLQALTWVLVTETQRFLRGLPDRAAAAVWASEGGGGGREQVAAEYTQLLARLNLV
jgi:hypothetical protein